MRFRTTHTNGEITSLAEMCGRSFFLVRGDHVGLEKVKVPGCWGFFEIVDEIVDHFVSVVSLSGWVDAF